MTIKEFAAKGYGVLEIPVAPVSSLFREWSVKHPPPVGLPVANWPGAQVFPFYLDGNLLGLFAGPGLRGYGMEVRFPAPEERDEWAMRLARPWFAAKGRWESLQAGR